MIGFKRCKCLCELIDWGSGYTIKGGAIKHYIYARCRRCKREKRIQIHDDTYHSLTVDFAHKMALKLWNEEEE